MMIHPTAIVHKNARLAELVSVGPFSTIGENVSIGKGTAVGTHCVIEGYTAIGERCKIFTGAVIGSAPQDLKYKGEKSFLKIGDDNVIREYVTMNPGTGAGGSTVIGDKNEFMAYAHIAHDCKIGSEVIIANLGTLAGHVTVEDRVVIGGAVAIHQFVRVGTLAIVGGYSKIVQDILPYSMTAGNPVKLYSINSVGLQRAGLSDAARLALKKALKFVQNKELSLPHALRLIEEKLMPYPQEVSRLVDFIKDSKRGITR